MLKTGYAERDIKLVVGMHMTGFLLRESVSAGIHDNLKIKSLAIEDEANKVLLIACDLLGLDDGFIHKTALEIERILRIPVENIIITCTHTHSGPASITLIDCGEVDPVWLEQLMLDIVECAKRAAIHTKPSLFSYRTGNSSIGHNRVSATNKEKADKRDSQVGVLTIRDACSKKIDTVIVNYGCHPVSLGPANLLYSRDYPHYLEIALKKSITSDVNVIFFNGCCGDQTPVQRASFEAAENLGMLLAESVMQAKPSDLNEKNFNMAAITVRTHIINIPMVFEYSKDYFEGLKETLSKELETALTNGSPDKNTKYYGAYIHWCDRMLEKLNSGNLNRELLVQVKILKIGDLHIITLPFEVFHDIGIRIKELFGFDRTMILCYANGNFGYLASKLQYHESKYEVPVAHRFYGHPGPACENAEEIIYSYLSHPG